MTTDLSQYDANQLPGADVLGRQHYAIVVADWNSKITHAMAQGAIDTFVKHGVRKDHIQVVHVPGTVELTFAAAKLIDHLKTIMPLHAIVVIGCVIKGETPHFDYVCQSVTEGVAMINARGEVPVVFSVLTTLNEQQALDRAGCKLGNKGVEGAITAIKMANLEY